MLKLFKVCSQTLQDGYQFIINNNGVTASGNRVKLFAIKLIERHVFNTIDWNEYDTPSTSVADLNELKPLGELHLQVH